MGDIQHVCEGKERGEMVAPVLWLEKVAWQAGSRAGWAIDGDGFYFHVSYCPFCGVKLDPPEEAT